MQMRSYGGHDFQPRKHWYRERNKEKEEGEEGGIGKDGRESNIPALLYLLQCLKVCRSIEVTPC